MADDINLMNPVGGKRRSARRSNPVETFDVTANVTAQFAREPFDDGDMARAAGRAAMALGDTLAKIVGRAEQRALAASVDKAGEEGAKAGGQAVSFNQPAPGNALDLIRQFEGFRETPYWDVNAHRAGYGSDTITRPDGSVVRVVPTSRVSRDDAQRDLARRAGEFARTAAGQVGEDRWNALPPAAQAALTSIAYNYGSLPQRIIPAIKNGNLGEIANAVRGLEGDNKGINKRRRNVEADLIARADAMPMPEIRPLQLRRDGTPQGEAYDAALLKTGGYQAKVAMQTGLDNLAQQYADDPAGFASEEAKLRQAYVQAFAADPQAAAIAEAEFELNAAPLRRKLQADAEQAADRDMKDRMSEAVTAQGPLLERQAYALGVNADGDRQLAALQDRALRTIDNALANGAISRAEAARQRQVTVARLTQARFDGVFDALKRPAERIAFAENLADPETRGELVAKLGETDYNTLAMRYQSRARQDREAEDAAARVEKQRFSRALDDDLASVASTGVGVSMGGISLSAAEVTRVLGPEKTAEWTAARAEAAKIFRATDGMTRLTPDQIEARLAEIAPKPGAEGFARAEASYQQAAKLAADINRRRADDPAAAVDEAFPELQDETLRSAPAALAQARLDHQAALGIPDLARQPLTNAEARQMANRLILYQNDPEAMAAALDGLVGEINGNYGPQADEVLSQVLRTNGINRDTAKAGAMVLQTLAQGNPPPPGQLRAVDRANGLDQAERAMSDAPAAPAAPTSSIGTRTPQPAVNPRGGRTGQAAPAARKPATVNAAAVEHLRAHPELAAEFDAYYGKGKAELYLRPEPQDYTLRTLADGSIEKRYKDGWIEIIYPDGRIDGMQGP